jgi:hypothetical protein
LNSQKKKKKHDNWENSRGKNRYSKAPGQTSDDKSISGSENQESPAKKPKLSSSNKDPDYNGDGNYFDLSCPLFNGSPWFAFLL